MATAEKPASMNEANQRDPYNNNSYGTLVDSGYLNVELPILDVLDFNDRIIRGYEDGTAEKHLPADLSVARSLVPAGTATLRDLSYVAPEIPDYITENCTGSAKVEGAGLKGLFESARDRREDDVPEGEPEKAQPQPVLRVLAGDALAGEGGNDRLLDGIACCAWKSHATLSAPVPRLRPQQPLSAENPTGEAGREQALVLIEWVAFDLRAGVDGLLGKAQLGEHAAASLAYRRPSGAGVDF